MKTCPPRSPGFEQAQGNGEVGTRGQACRGLSSWAPAAAVPRMPSCVTPSSLWVSTSRARSASSRDSVCKPPQLLDPVLDNDQLPRASRLPQASIVRNSRCGSCRVRRRRIPVGAGLHETCRRERPDPRRRGTRCPQGPFHIKRRHRDHVSQLVRPPSRPRRSWQRSHTGRGGCRRAGPRRCVDHTVVSRRRRRGTSCAPLFFIEPARARGLRGTSPLSCHRP